MKRLLFLLVAIGTLAAPILADITLAGNVTFGSGYVAPSAASYLLEENFEGANNGYDLTGWTEVLSPNQNYTTLPLQGSESLRITGDAEYTYHTFTGQTEVDVYFKFRADVLPTTPAQCLSMTTAGLGANLLIVRVFDTGELGIRHGTIDIAATSAPISAATDVHVWAHYKNDGTGTIAWSTTGTRPVSGTAFASGTGGDATGTAAIVAPIKTGVSGEFIYDRLLVSTSAIGNNP